MLSEWPVFLVNGIIIIIPGPIVNFPRTIPFPIFADKAAAIKDKLFIEALFDRLEEESNPHVYIKVPEALIKYGEANINKRILEVRKKNKDLNKDGGGDEFDKLLKENHIN